MLSVDVKGFSVKFHLMLHWKPQSCWVMLCCKFVSTTHTLGLFRHNYWRKLRPYLKLEIANGATCCSAFCSVALQFDLLLKLFEDEDKAKVSASRSSGITGRAGQNQRDTKKTVGLQVRPLWPRNRTFHGVIVVFFFHKDALRISVSQHQGLLKRKC